MWATERRREQRSRCPGGRSSRSERATGPTPVGSVGERARPPSADRRRRRRAAVSSRLRTGFVRARRRRTDPGRAAVHHARRHGGVGRDGRLVVSRLRAEPLHHDLGVHGAAPALLRRAGDESDHRAALGRRVRRGDRAPGDSAGQGGHDDRLGDGCRARRRRAPIAGAVVIDGAPRVHDVGCTARGRTRRRSWSDGPAEDRWSGSH